MNQNNKSYIPNCLRKYRKIRGVSQIEVAKVLRLKSSSVVSRWEQGKCLPKPLNIFRLAVLYRTMTDALYIDLIRKIRKEIVNREKRVFHH